MSPPRGLELFKNEQPIIETPFAELMYIPPPTPVTPVAAFNEMVEDVNVAVAATVYRPPPYKVVAVFAERTEDVIVIAVPESLM